MSAKGIARAQKKTAAAFLAGRVDAHVAHEQIEPSIPVEIEEHRAGRVPGIIKPRLARDVTESSAAQVLEKHVAAPHRGNKQIGQSVVVDVGEGRGDVDAPLQRHAGPGGDVLELPLPHVSPELVRAKLVHKINVQPAIAIHVGDRDPAAVVVVDALPVLQRIIDAVMLERDAALGHLIGKSKIMKRLAAPARLRLLALTLREHLRHFTVHDRIVNDVRGDPRRGGFACMDTKWCDRPKGGQNYSQRGDEAKVNHLFAAWFSAGLKTGFEKVPIRKNLLMNRIGRNRVRAPWCPASWHGTWTW